MKASFWVVIGAVVAVSGCETDHAYQSEVVTTTTTETTVTATVVETTTVSATPETTMIPVPAVNSAEPVSQSSAGVQSVPSSSVVDIFKEPNRPCGTVAADAPKFVEPDKE